MLLYPLQLEMARLRLVDVLQELQHDPLGILRPASKLHHQLPLASAYAALAGCRDGSTAVQRQQRRMDSKTREPKVGPSY